MTTTDRRLGGAALAAAAVSVAAMGQNTAEEVPSPQDIYRELQHLRSEVAAFRAQEGRSHLSAQRAEAIRGLVAEVLADADHRAAMLDKAVLAGYDGGFFIGSVDGDFLLKVGGQIQFRYILNSREDDADAVDDWVGGFLLRRVKLNFAGHIGSPRLTYVVQLAADRNSGDVQLEDAILGYSCSETLRVWGGRFQNPFAREQIMSSKRQLAVDRSAVANIFAGNDGYVEGVGVAWKAVPDVLTASLTINDGFNSGAPGGANTGFLNTPNDFANDSADFAVTTRADWRLVGDFAQAADVAAWSSDAPTHAFVGAGLHYEVGETGDSQAMATVPTVGDYDRFLIWTVDALVKHRGLGVTGAVFGWQIDAADGSPFGDTDHYAAVVQAGYMVIPDRLEPFVRYEWIDVDDAVDPGDLRLVTGGFNYYLRGHSAKLTADVVWALDSISAASTLGTGLSGIGLLRDAPGQDDQVVGRLQFQLLF